MTRQGLPAVRVHCRRCQRVAIGRYFNAEWCEGRMGYCTRCPALQLVPSRRAAEPDPGPAECRCGGDFTSRWPRCRYCGSVIRGAEQQLAPQVYGVEPARDARQPTVDEIRRWYQRLRHKRFFTGHSLFVQTDFLLAPDEERQHWRWYRRFEI